MKLRRHTIIATLALLAASCAHEESEVAQSSYVQVVIEASFSDMVTETKATATAFESGDMLGLYAVKSGGELNAASNLINNHKLKVAESGAIVGDQLPAYYPDKSSSLDLFSYYPYQSGNATADALGVLVGIRTHQTDFSLLQASDLCYGRKLDAAPSAAPHPLQFSHSFAQLRLNFSLYEGCSAIATVKLLSIKDQAKLNLQTGVVTLLTSSVVDVDPYVNNLLSYTAIVPAQSLSGACVEIELKDGTIYYYHATAPIALQASATNTLNLHIADRKMVTASGAPVVGAWGAVSSSGSLGESANNLVTLYWLAPHASYASIDKITVSLVDIFNQRREVDVTPTIDPLSSSEYATYTFPLILGADAGYPQIVEGLKLYAGSTLLRDSPRAAILGSVLSKAGAHTIGLNLAIEISEENWDNVAWQGATKTVTVTPIGTTEWTATSNNSNLTITKSGNKAILTWAMNGSATGVSRSAEVTFATNPAGASAKFTTTQLGVIDRIKIGNLWWATGNLVAVAGTTDKCRIGAPTDGGLCFQFGSLLGWKGGANGDGTGICNKANGTFFSGVTFKATDEISVVPTIATATITAIGTTWPNQAINLYYFGLSTYATSSAKLHDFAGFAAGTLADKGIGDPCRYYLGGTWRTPTVEEHTTMCNNSPGGGLGQANAAWTTSPSTGMNFNNNGIKLFIPASGHRVTNGTFMYVGGTGYAWSASVDTAVAGCVLSFDSGVVNPRYGHPRYYGMPVRCVSN